MSPVAHLRAVQVDKQDLRRQRRPLEPDEVRRLLETTRYSEPSFGLTRYKRAMIYRLAIESGLRANEIRQLKRVDFDFNNCTVTVRDNTAKNRREKTLPLRPDTANKIEAMLSMKLPDFSTPDSQSQKKTGTDDVNVTTGSVLASCLALSCARYSPTTPLGGKANITGSVINSISQRARQDSNLQPSDSKSATLSN